MLRRLLAWILRPIVEAARRRYEAAVPAILQRGDGAFTPAQLDALKRRRSITIHCTIDARS